MCSGGVNKIKYSFSKYNNIYHFYFQELNDSVRNAQERVPPEDRIARRTERQGDPTEAGEYVVEKILAKRFNPRRKQYEYLLKWEGYPQ